MRPSIFAEIVAKFLSVVVGGITEKFNGKAAQEELLHKTMLREEYTPDLTWNATEIDNSIVAADIVSLDSSLPLKERATIEHASGKIAKIGAKFGKKEKHITDINIMMARGTDQSTIVSRILGDVELAAKSIDIRTEIMFLEGLSTGMYLATDDDNNGTGIRVNFGYKAENTFHADVAWGASGYTPVDDLQKMFDKADEDGNTISDVYMSKKYFDLLRHSAQGKKLVANFKEQVIVNVANLEPGSRSTMLDALADEFNATFHVVNSSFKIENRDGSKTTIKPFAEASVVGTTSNVVGRLVYGTLAEETNPVEGVNYEKVGSHILISKYSKNDPLEEFTAAQSLVMPVIDNGGSTYLLHANATAEGISVEDSSISFDAAGGSEETTIHYDGSIADVTISVPGSATWLTAKRRRNTIILTATTNSGSSRSANVTISAGGNSCTIAVSQSA